MDERLNVIKTPKPNNAIAAETTKRTHIRFGSSIQTDKHVASANTEAMPVELGFAKNPSQRPATNIVSVLLIR